MRLSDLVQCSEDMAAVGSRNAKTLRLVDLLQRVTDGDELTIAVNFLIGQLRQGRIGIGPRALQEAKPSTSAPQPSLVVRQVDEVFTILAALKGPGSTRERVRQLTSLMEQATDSEQRFLGLLIFGELHQGAMEGVMLEAIAKAASVSLSVVRRAVMATGDLAGVAVSALLDGSEALASLTMELFRPVQPMLAQPASDVAEVLKQDRTFVAELKLDGARIQVHKRDDMVRVYSRRLRDVTHAVPEVVELVRMFPVQSVVLDGEVLALHPGGRPRPFQTTMRRFGRKLDVDQLRVEIPLTPFFFDLLYCDGEVFIDQPLAQRSKLLEELAGTMTIPSQAVRDRDAAVAFLGNAMSMGHEGIMIKALDSSYEAGARGADWFKIKPTHTLDLIVLAADWGHGRRTGLLSNLHLGARDPATGGFVMLGKTFKGMTDRVLRWQTEQLQALEIARDKYTVHVKPELVVEVTFNDVQKSSRYPAGLALRFARIMRYRDDKSPADVDTIDKVRAIHLQSVQEGVR